MSKLSLDKLTSESVICTISRNGDLAYRTYLQVTLPEDQDMNASGHVHARWLDFPGEQLIAQVEVEIGGQRIDRQYGDWMHIWNQVTLSKEQQDGYYKMVGNTTQLTYITDPGFANVSGPCAAEGGPAQVCAPRNALPETTFTFIFNSGSAATLVLPFPLLPSNTTRSRLTLTSAPLVSASGP